MSRTSTSRRLALARTVGVASALVALAPTATASPLLETVGAAGGEGGVQGTVAGPSAASTFDNPALLVDASEEFLVGFVVASEQLGIHLDGRRGGDVPSVVAGRDILGPDGLPIRNDTVPTEWLRSGCAAGTGQGDCPPPGFAKRPRQAAGTGSATHTYLALGIVKHLVPDRFSVGAYALMPFKGFITANAFYADEREALFSNSLHSELYGDRLTSLSFVFGAAFKILPTLSLGAGISLGFTNAAGSSTYVRDTTDYDKLLLNTSVETHLDVAPTIGVRWLPVPGLRIGAALHAPEKFVVETTIKAALPSGTESSTTRRDVYDWMPWSVSFGAEGDVARRGSYSMTLVGSVKYSLWSSYEDRHGQNPADYGQDLAWKDVLSFALGMRHRFGETRVLVDFRYVPSPVPQQVGASNYVDQDRLGVTLGADTLLAVGTTRLRPGVSVFANRLLSRHETKDDSRIRDELPDGSVLASTRDPVAGAAGLQTNNPGWPGYSSSGWIWGGMITITAPL